VYAVMPRKVETGQQLHRLEQVNNARDLAEACANIRPGLLFRSACPNAATAADIEILRDQLRIRQLVGLFCCGHSLAKHLDWHCCLLMSG
jgi:Tyrosine phosphatase family